MPVLAITIVVLSTNWTSIGRFTSLSGQNYDVQEGVVMTNMVRRITDTDGEVMERLKSSQKGLPLPEKRLVAVGASFQVEARTMNFTIPPVPPSPLTSQKLKE